jgi:hypothetical protein
MDEDGEPIAGPAQKSGFGFLVAVGFTLNYVVGSGFLTLPFATAKTGK